MDLTNAAGSPYTAQQVIDLGCILTLSSPHVVTNAVSAFLTKEVVTNAETAFLTTLLVKITSKSKLKNLLFHQGRK